MEILFSLQDAKAKLGKDTTDCPPPVSHFIALRAYPKKEISTPAATAEPITPEMLLDMQ